MFNTNPEFIKNCKLELSLLRIIVCCVLTLLICYIAYETSSSKSYLPETAAEIKAENVFGALCTIGFLFAIIWGSHLASSSITEEIRQRTWTFLSMSPLSAGRVLMGKLFGATSLVWSTSLLIILPAIFICVKIAQPGEDVIRSEIVTAAILTGTLGCWMIASHALAITFSLGDYTYQKANERRTSMGVTFAIFMIGASVGPAILESLERFMDASKTSGELPKDGLLISPGVYMRMPEKMDWYSLNIFGLDMAFICLAFVAFWSVIAAYRTIRKSLLFRDTPWVWASFLIVTSWFVQGFRTDPTDSQAFSLFWPVMLSLSTLLVLSLTEARDIIRYQMLIKGFKEKNYRKALQSLPLWMVSAIIFMITSILTVFMSANMDKSIAIATSLWLFLCRDLLAIHALSCNPSVKRPIIAIGVYGAVIYALIPMLISEPDNAIFYPIVPFLNDGPEVEAFGYLGLMGTEIAIASWYFRRQLRKALPVRAQQPAAS